MYSQNRAQGVIMSVVIGLIAPCSCGQPALQRLKSFGFGDRSGASSQAPLIIGTDGALYGTTRLGGSRGKGAVFTVNTDGSSFRVLHSFGPTGGDGETPYAAVMQGSDGTLYGTTRYGGTNLWNGIPHRNYGTVFRLNPDGTGFSLLHSFTDTGQDYEPTAALVQGTNGTLYGTAGRPGDTFGGVVFKLNTNGSGYAAVAGSGGSGTCLLSDFRNALLMDADGALYGTTRGGGCNGVGTIFRVQSDGGLAVLHHFQTGSGDGFNPSAGLLLSSDGALYGTTPAGGNSNVGTIFKLSRDGTGYAVLLSFTTAAGAAQRPYGALIQGSDGLLYGTTGFGGSDNSGTVFRISTNGTEHAVLYSFRSSGGDGRHPFAALVQGGDGTLYGITHAGGQSGQGTIFKLNTNGTGYAVLWHFSATGGDGQNPYAAVVQGTDGALYGTTSGGGSINQGTVFKIATNGTDYLVIHDFGVVAGDAARPYAALVQGIDGSLYGTTSGGGAGDVGTVFKLTPNGDVYSVLHHFGTEAGDGQSPFSHLVQGSDGALYGTTSSGGSNSMGTVFRLATNGVDYSVLYSFRRDNGDGRFPYAGLVQGSDGLLYGTTPFGGSNGMGTVFKIAADGTAYTVLHSFSDTDGEAPYPYAALIQGSDGALYGTCSGSTWPDPNFGAVFKLNTDGTGHTVLHQFGSSRGDGWHPRAALLQGSDGVLYGTTQWGGADATDPGGLETSGSGALVRLNTNGSGYEVIHSFSADGSSGLYLFAPLTLGRDGGLYGTAAYGGDATFGTVFRWGSSPPSASIVAQPRFSSATLLPRQVFQLSFDGTTNLEYRIEASSNLVNWVRLTTVTASNGSARFTDASAINFRQRFYRIAWEP